MGAANSMVAHKWAHGQASKGSNFRTDGKELISYSTLVGYNCGNGLVFISASSMSPSTGKQLSYARRAVNHLDVVSSPIFRYGSNPYQFDEKQAFKMACEALNETLEGLSKGRLSKYLAYSMDRALEEVGRLVVLADRYGFEQWQIVSIPDDKIKATRDYAAKTGERESIAREQRRVKEFSRMEQQRLIDAVAFDRWQILGEGSCPSSYRTDANGGYYLTVKGDKVVTSGGAECPVEHARIGLHFWAMRKHTGIEPACVWEPWQRNGQRVQLGVFQLDRIDAAGNAFAGCHKFSAEELNRLYHLLCI